MARTALNVNGAIMTGVITSKVVKIDEVRTESVAFNNS
jgi:L-cystine uptake protein TcyP (sodium:dicarboxylate symporter family)